MASDRARLRLRTTDQLTALLDDPATDAVTAAWIRTILTERRVGLTYRLTRR